MDSMIRSTLINFLKEHQNTFTWFIDHIVRISLEVTIHKLEIDPNYPLVNQKRRKFTFEHNKIINEEERLKQKGYIREVYYPK